LLERQDVNPVLPAILLNPVFKTQPFRLTIAKVLPP